MASIVDPPPSVHHTRSEAIAGGKKKSDIEMYHAMQSTTNTKGTKREDPLKILDPSSKKLVTVESQRIMAVLDDTICKIRLITLLPELTQNTEKYASIISDDIQEMLKEHYKLEVQFSKVFLLQEEEETVAHTGSAKRGGIDGDVEQMSYESLCTYRGQLQQQIRHSTRSIVRLFTRNHSALKAVLGQVSERPSAATSLISTSNNLRSIIMEKLLTTREEEEERSRYIQQIIQREAKASVEVKKLEGLLQEASEEREADLNKRNVEIKKLKSDLAQLQKSSNETNKRIKSDSMKQELTDTKTSGGKCDRLNQSIAQLRTQLAQAVAEHRQSEQILRSRKIKTESALETWIAKYDTDMGERQEEYEQIEAVYKVEKQQLEDLEERFAVLEEEYNRIIEERRVNAELKAEEERRLRLLTKAAVVIQAHWRSYATRKKLKQKKKGKKGKKGK